MAPCPHTQTLPRSLPTCWHEASRARSSDICRRGLHPPLSVRNDQQDDHEHNAPGLARQRPEDAEEKTGPRYAPLDRPVCQVGMVRRQTFSRLARPADRHRHRRTPSDVSSTAPARKQSHVCPKQRQARIQARIAQLRRDTRPAHPVRLAAVGTPGLAETLGAARLAATLPRLGIAAPTANALSLCRQAAGEGRRYPAAPVRTPHGPAGHGASVPWGAHVSRRDRRGVPVPGGPWCAPNTRPKASARLAPWGVHVSRRDRRASPVTHRTLTRSVDVGNAQERGARCRCAPHSTKSKADNSTTIRSVHVSSYGS